MWPGAGPSVLRIQRGQQPGRALSVIAWPPVCEGRQIPFHEVWHGKANRPTPNPKALEWQKKERRKVQTPSVDIKVDFFGDEPFG